MKVLVEWTRRRRVAGLAVLLSLLLAAFLAGCGGQPAAEKGAPAPAAENAVGNRDVILATTTSTQDSGLLDVLLPEFERQTGYRVKTNAVGTGQALALGEKGEADILLVHAPAAEKPLVEKGVAIDRRLVMHNDFIIVGPAADPAGIKSAGSAPEAFGRIARAGATFVSRGDDSGTHKKEKEIWQAAGLTPQGNWYVEAGQGMAQTLNVANEKQAYALTDRATYLALRDTLKLALLAEGDKSLLNVYHVMLVNPARFTKVNAAGAKALADFLTGEEGQKMIAEFGVDKYGQPLFFADAGKPELE